MIDSPRESMRGRIESEVFSNRPFPENPFKHDDWVGVIFNRDKYGAAGIPRETFESLARCVESTGRGRGEFLFTPAVCNIESGQNDFPAFTFRSWGEYLAAMRRMRFCPEFYLTDQTLDWIVWVDPDASVIGGRSKFLSEAIDTEGGPHQVLVKSLNGFGIREDDRLNPVNKYARALMRS